MKPVLTYYGEVAPDGKLTIFKRAQFIAQVAKAFITIGKPTAIEVSIRHKTKRRTNLQNNAYWALTIPTVQEGLFNVGYKMTKEQVHELLKYRFLKTELVNEQTGEIMDSVGSTSGLTTTEHLAYEARVKPWALDYLGVTIPDPDPDYRLDHKD